MKGGSLGFFRRILEPLELPCCFAARCGNSHNSREPDMFRRNVLQAVMLVAATPIVALAQSETVDPGTTGPAWSPYLVGGLIGVLSMFTFYFSDKPLGASTAYARVAGLIGQLFARRHTDSLCFYAEKKTPKIGWEVMVVAGIVVGAFAAAFSGGEITARWLPPMWTERFGDSIGLRLAIGFLGGGLMAFGARMAGGCTSGHGISGTMQLAVGSWIALLSFFVGGVVIAMLMFYV